MKKSYPLTRLNSVLSYGRFLLGGTFLSAAVAMAFVGATGNNIFGPKSSTGPGKYPKSVYGFASHAESSEDALTDQESAESPDEAAVQDYQNRAYPAAYIPFKLTANAQKAWAKIKSQRNKNTTGSWTLAGPSHADFPATTTFSGAAYTSSGRVTALVVDPACN